jgi:putative ABC transport system ATP-binding protein
VSVLLEARELSAVLQGDAGDVRILDGVSLRVGAGEVVDIVGPSGSGKSTLLRALAQLLPGATGELLVDGASSTQIPPAAWRLRVALLPQKPIMFAGTLRDNLLFPYALGVRKGAPRPAETRLAEALERLGVDAALDREATRLSVGQAARVAFLRTLLTGPSVLLLDEPDAALDDVSADAVAAMTAEFAARARAGGAPAAVVRVRHHRSDGIASRRLHLEDGHLTDVTAVAR